MIEAKVLCYGRRDLDGRFVLAGRRMRDGTEQDILRPVRPLCGGQHNGARPVLAVLDAHLLVLFPEKIIAHHQAGFRFNSHAISTDGRGEGLARPDNPCRVRRRDRREARA